jgi:hypothetical protein
VHDHADAVCHDAVLGMLRRAVELYIVEARQGRYPMTPLVTELIEDQSCLWFGSSSHILLPESRTAARGRPDRSFEAL